MYKSRRSFTDVIIRIMKDFNREIDSFFLILEKKIYQKKKKDNKKLYGFIIFFIIIKLC